MANIKRLIADLEDAVRLASQFSGGYSNQHWSAEEFHADLVKGVERLKVGDMSVLDDMWGWFAPTCSWDDLIGQAGIDLGNRIFQQLVELKR